MDIPKRNTKADLIYKEVGEQKLCLTFLPPTREVYEKSPLYFIIPGGGWHVETRQSMIEFSQISVDRLRDNGFAVASIDYRVVADGNGVCMNDIISDCFDAMRYLVHYSDVLKIDKNKVVTSGHSAGAHLALMVAYAPQKLFVNNSVFDDEFKVIATAGLSAPTALYEVDGKYHLGFGIDDLFCNGNTEDNRKKVSPLSYVSDKSPATILAAGTKDNLVFCSSSELLYKTLCANRVIAKLVLSEGAGHSYEQISEGEKPSLTAAEIQNIISEFILKCVKR